MCQDSQHSSRQELSHSWFRLGGSGFIGLGACSLKLSGICCIGKVLLHSKDSFLNAVAVVVVGSPRHRSTSIIYIYIYIYYIYIYIYIYICIYIYIYIPMVSIVVPFWGYLLGSLT